jgi:hypothetical protein
MGLLRRITRRREPGLSELTPVPAMADLPKAKLQSPARYLGTVTDDGQKIVGHTLSVRSSSRLHLSTEGLDVVRMAGSFRIPVPAMRGATTAAEFDGKPVEALLLVRWEHEGQPWRTGFRLEAGKNIRSGANAPDLDQWVRTISKMSRKSARGE